MGRVHPLPHPYPWLCIHLYLFTSLLAPSGQADGENDMEREAEILLDTIGAAGSLKGRETGREKVNETN